MNSLILAVVVLLGCSSGETQYLGKVVVHRRAPMHHQPTIHQPQIIAEQSRSLHSSDLPQFRSFQQSHEIVYPEQPRNPGDPVAILSMNQDFKYDGNFNYEYQSEDGIQSKTSGTVRSIEGSEHPAQIMKGSYSYTAPDGRQVVTSWYADETGFHAYGDHLPVAPPVPPAIQRSLEYLKSLPPWIDESNPIEENKKIV